MIRKAVPATERHRPSSRCPNPRPAICLCGAGNFPGSICQASARSIPLYPPTSPTPGVYGNLLVSGHLQHGFRSKVSRINHIDHRFLSGNDLGGAHRIGEGETEREQSRSASIVRFCAHESCKGTGRNISLFFNDSGALFRFGHLTSSAGLNAEQSMEPKHLGQLFDTTCRAISGRSPW